MLDISYCFFVVVCPFVQTKVSGWEDVTWYWHKRSQGKSKLIQTNAFTVAALISNVDVKNMGNFENSNEK